MPGVHLCLINFKNSFMSLVQRRNEENSDKEEEACETDGQMKRSAEG